MTKPLLSSLRGDCLKPPPIWLMRQAGRYLPEYRMLRKRARGFFDFCYRPELAAAATLQPVERFELDAAILFSDILVIPQALGQKIDFVEGKGPVLDPIRGSEDLARLSCKTVTERLAPVYETVERVAERLPATVTLIGFAGAPWTVAVYMVEGHGGGVFEAARRWALGDEESFGRLIDHLTEATVAHLCAQIEAGAEVVQLFESWAGLLPEAAFTRWCVAPVAKITRMVKSRFPDIPVIVFPRGAGAQYAGYAQATGVDAVSLDLTVPLDWAVKEIQPHAALQGNLDPQMVVIGGVAMRRAAREIIAKLGEGPFLFNLGHGVLPETPPDHVADLVRTVRGG